MSVKESKAILKEVREAIKNENYSEAIKKCESLLSNEPKNYMAYLLLGAAYQKSNKTEAAKHLRKSVEYSPAAPTVALQGLANCAPVEELPEIYEQLLKFAPEKYVEYYEKLFTLSSNSSVSQDILNVLKREAQAGIQDERKKLVLKYLARIWIGGNFEVPDSEESLFKSVLEESIADTQLDIHVNAYKRYLKLLYNKGNKRDCIKQACTMIEQYPSEIYPYEWICKIYCDTHDTTTPSNIEWQSDLFKPIKFYADALLKLNENSSLAILIKAIDLYNEQQFVAARECLYKVQKLQPSYEVALNLLARTEMELGAYGMSMPLWEKLNNLQEDYAICLSYSNEKEKLKKAIDLLSGFKETSPYLNALARCYFKLNEVENLKLLPLDDLTKAEYIMAPTEAVIFLQNTGDLETFPTLLCLGKFQLKLCNYAEALTCLLKATRLQPHRSECFYYLGKIYYATEDLVRARKCFEKCIHLNPIWEEAVNNLSAIYQQINERDLNEALLLNTLKFMKSENPKRVYYKLGLHYLTVKMFDDAIHSFRMAIKFDVSSMNYWESLGDAYSERGSYNSAIRVFQKILEMDSTNIYAKLQTALMKTTIRMYTEAIEDFDNLLREHPDYLPGLKGAAGAHIGLANNLMSEHRYGYCKDHLQLAMNHLQRAFLIHDNHDMVWLWRLTANVFLQTAQMPTSMANLEVSGKLAKRDTEIAFLNRRDLLNIALRFFFCAIKQKPNTFLWYELSLCSYYNALYIEEESQSHMELAIKAAKMAIEEQKDRWQNWNLLGVINMHKIINNLPLAQHCFIQALNLERKSYSTWTNLGVLYLRLGEIKLANQAFQRAQQSRPIFPNAWIGQAMIAEAIGEEEEALDLFRHCQQFDFHLESSLGYAHWVCTILTNPELCQQPHYRHAIENMYADVVALDAINWYVVNEENDASAAALSFQGFLNERQKHYQPAAKAYLKAIEKSDVNSERDKILTNLGYVYLKLNRPNDAINAFNKVTQATFKPIIGLALAYVRAGQNQEAYSVYNSVLKTVTGSDDTEAAHILVAMAAMVYASQGEVDTKTILYQCILLKGSPIQALYSACALGIIHRDNQLTETILMELKKYENLFDYCANIAFLRSQYYLANKQIRKARVYLITRVHIFPECAEIRRILANFLLDYCNLPGYHVATSQVALAAIDLMHRNKTKKSNPMEDAKALMLAGRALFSVDKHRSMKILQRAIRLYPRNNEAWKTLFEMHRFHEVFSFCF